MLTHNFVHYLGYSLEMALGAIEDAFFGDVVVYTPSQVEDSLVKPSRLKVFVNDQNVITRIING